MTNRDSACLLDMLRAANVILAVTQGRHVEDMEQDVTLQSTVYWQICVMGEAANNLSDDFQRSNPETPWREIVGIRNRLIHGYREIKDEIVWHVVRNQIPELAKFLAPLVSLDDPNP